MHAGGGQQRQPDLVQRLQKRNEGGAVILKTRKVQHGLALDVGQIFNSRHLVYNPFLETGNYSEGI
jgi:hypothetical protein